MHPPLKFSAIRRSITAIACTAAIVISAGCGDSSLPKLGNSSPNQTLQTQEIDPLFGNNSIVDERTLQQHIRGYDPVSSTHAWVAPAGNIPIMVGASSTDIGLNGTVQTAATTPAAAPAAPAAPAPAATAAPATSAPLAPAGRAALEVP